MPFSMQIRTLNIDFQRCRDSFRRLIEHRAGNFRNHSFALNGLILRVVVLVVVVVVVLVVVVADIELFTWLEDVDPSGPWVLWWLGDCLRLVGKRLFYWLQRTEDRGFLSFFNPPPKKVYIFYFNLKRPQRID